MKSLRRGGRLAALFCCLLVCGGLASGFHAERAGAQAVVPTSGAAPLNLNALNASAAILLSGYRGSGVQVSGTWQGTLVVEVSLDASHWAQVPVMSVGSGAQQSAITANGTYQVVYAGGMVYERVRESAYTSGTATGILAATASVSSYAPFDTNGYMQTLGADRATVPLWAWLFNCDAGSVTISGYFTNHNTGEVGSEWQATVTAGTPVDFQALYTASGGGAINWSAVDGFEGVVTMNGSASRLYYAKGNSYNGVTISDGTVTHWSYLPYYSAGTLLVGRVSN
jgi:hypothetical protein